MIGFSNSTKHFRLKPAVGENFTVETMPFNIETKQVIRRLIEFQLMPKGWKVGHIVRFASFDNFQIGMVQDDNIYDISQVGDSRWRHTRYAMTEFIREYDRLKEFVNTEVLSVTPKTLSSVNLLPPVPLPAHLFAAPLNYQKHVKEMTGSNIVSAGFIPQSAAELGFFLKATGSLVGASGFIELPSLPGREFHHEAELGVIIGKEGRNLDPENALEVVFGYTCLIDVTLRNTPHIQQERVLRKSFETFTPLGPYVVTSDEVGDPGNLDIELRVDGELRQKANTSQMISSVGELLAATSRVITLQPGDVFATGTSEGVGPIVPGNVVKLYIERIGELEIPVRTRSW